MKMVVKLAMLCDLETGGRAGGHRGEVVEVVFGSNQSPSEGQHGFSTARGARMRWVGGALRVLRIKLPGRRPGETSKTRYMR